MSNQKRVIKKRDHEPSNRNPEAGSHQLPPPAAQSPAAGSTRPRGRRLRTFLGLLLVMLALAGLTQISTAEMPERPQAEIQQLLPSAAGALPWERSLFAPQSSANSPQAADAISQKATLIMDGDKRILSAVIDQAAGFAYFGTDTTPGTIIKVRLSDFTRVSAITLQDGEDKLSSAVIDPAGGFAYFGTNTSPGIVVKVRLADFKRVGALSLPAQGGDVALNKLTSAVIDTGNGFAYFGTDTSSALIGKISLADFSRVAQLPLNSGEDNLSTAVIDTSKGYAYFGTRTSPAKVVKIKLSDFTRSGAVTLSDGSGADQIEKNLSASVIDMAREEAYFTTDSSSGLVVRMDIREGSFQRIGVRNTGTDKILSAVIDTDNSKIYFATRPDSGSAEIGKLDIQNFDTAPVQVVNTGSSSSLWGAVIDTNNDFAYFGAYEDPAKVFKINVSTADFALAGALTLDSTARNFWAAVIDQDAGFAYFGSYEQPARVAKVRLSDFSRVSTLRLDNTDVGILSGVIDTDRGFAYFGTNTSPAKVVKVRLADFTRVGAVTLQSGESRLTSAVIDMANGFAYFGTDTSPGIVVKIDLQAADFAADGRVGAVTLEDGGIGQDGEDRLRSAVIDTTNNFAYFGTYTGPGKVVKMNVDPNNFARTAVANLSTGEDKLTSAVIDAAQGYAYFGTNTNPGRVVEIDINPNNSFSRKSTATTTVNRLSSAVIDTDSGMAYFGSQEASGKVSEVALSPLAQQSAITLQISENYLTSAVIDTARGCAYFGAGDSEAGNFGSNYNPPGLSNRVMKIQTGACKDGTTTTLTSAPNPSNANENVLFTAEVSATTGTPSGQVVFTENGSTLATSPLNNGVATFNKSDLSPGPHTIVATYSGDGAFDASSAEHTHTVIDNRTATTTTLESTPNPSTVNEQVTFTARVNTAAGSPSGSVAFSEGGTTLGTSTLNNGVATFLTNSLSVGDHAIVAKYSGDATYAPSNSIAINQTVKAGGGGGGGSEIFLPIVLAP